MKLALKIDVETLRGTREGVPAIVDLLQRHGADATFLFTFGRDRHMRMPGMDIGRRAGDLMRHVKAAGFETGVRAIDGDGWMRGIVDAEAAWVDAQMQRAVDRYADVFGERPQVHGAPGWRMNAHALRLTQRLGFTHCSDGRGRGPHLPVWNAELIRCPQFPTTLPTADELLASGRVPQDTLAAHLLEQTADDPREHVYNAFAEREGAPLLPVLEQLVVGWQAQGRRVVALRALAEDVEAFALPRCEVGWGSVPGCAFRVMVQQDEFLGEVDGPLDTNELENRA